MPNKTICVYLNSDDVRVYEKHKKDINNLVRVKFREELERLKA